MGQAAEVLNLIKYYPCQIKGYSYRDAFKIIQHVIQEKATGHILFQTTFLPDAEAWLRNHLVFYTEIANVKRLVTKT